MALKVSSTTGGTWATAASWDSVTNTPTLHATTNITHAQNTTIYSNGAVGTGANTTGTFTAPNTTNACTGAVVHNAAVSGSTGGVGTIALALQEWNGSSWDTKVTSSTITGTKLYIYSLGSGINWIRFAFDTPYVFTTTSPGYYRFILIRNNAAITTSPLWAAESTGAAFAFIATDNRTGVPASNDNVMIVGYNRATIITITMGVNTTIGAGSETTVATIAGLRSFNGAIMLGADGILAYGATSTVNLTCTGGIYIYPAGIFQSGDGASTISSAYTHTCTMAQGGVNGNYGIVTINGAKMLFNGALKSSTSLWKTTYVSGTGTSADPLIVADSVNWEANDEIVFGANTLAHCGTTYFIQTVNSGTSYVLSATSGGAAITTPGIGAGFVTTDRIINVQRNIIFTSDNASYGSYMISANGAVLIPDILTSFMTFKWCRFTRGAALTNKCWIINTGTAWFNCDYSVFYGTGTTISTSQVGTPPLRCSFTGVVNYTGLGVFSFSNTSRIDVIDCIGIKSTSMTFSLYASDCTFTRCIAIGAATSRSGFDTQIFTNFNIFTDCEAHLCYYGFSFSTTSALQTITRMLLGTKGKNTICDIVTALTNSYVQQLLNNCSFGSDTRISTNYSGLVNKMYIALQSINLADNHEFYTNAGYFITSSGAMNMKNTSASLSHYANYTAGTGTSGQKILVGANLKINSANYYAGVHTNPTIQVNYDLGTLSTAGVAINSTSTQTINTIFTPTTSNNVLTLTISGMTDAITSTNGDVLWNYLYYNARLYGNVYKTFNYPTIKIDSNTIFIIPSPATNPYIAVTNSATVSGYSEFTIDHSTQTVTITSSTTLNRLYDYSQYDLTLDANMDKAEWFTTLDGVNYTSTYNITLNTGVDLTGGGSINVGALTFTKTGTATYDGIIITSSDRQVHALITGLMAGSRVQIYDTDTSTELYNDIVAGTSLDYIHTWTTDVNVRIRIKYTDASSAYLEYKATGTITNTGFALVANQIIDSVYATNGIDGSTVTECSVSGATIRIYVDDPDNTITFQKVYNWYQYILFTSTGIEDQDANYFYAISAVEYRFNPSMKIINSDVTNALTVMGANIAPTTGTDSIIDNSNGASVVIYSYFPVDASGSLTLLPTIAQKVDDNQASLDLLSNIPDDLTILPTIEQKVDDIQALTMLTL